MNMPDDLQLLVSGDDRDSLVQIPIKKKDFGDFVTNLLGQPETIEWRRSGSFDIDFGWLVHIHHLLDQRVTQQNHSSLVDFSAVIKYEKGPERRLNDIDSFLHFNEAKKEITKSVKLTWTYLVSFPNKPAPEKQEVSIYISTNSVVKIRFGSTSNTREETEGRGDISCSIAYTERTWGDDIESLLKKETDSIIEKPKWYKSALDFSLFLLVMSFFISGIIVPDYIEQLIQEQNISQIFQGFIPESGNIESLKDSEKLDLIVKVLDPSSKLHAVEAWFRVVSFLAGIALSAMAMMLLMMEKPSFLVVTKSDEERREKLKRQKTKKFIMRSLSFIVAVSAGVAGNYLYYYLTVS
ncbi:hypothetical protein DV711_05645 [Motiliproteus coralliicola]|uniref:Uncharacterized protein n=1 Tax=Motiliproteus coralliicola TaxID=2283196 RepID=A0A369WSH5_9GAMM|nr:hypothetical protein [Motiliproteus coralliicola]RDE25048.1 hypothetical protein DV711_05645 [Motiliproteus coralliicola]